MQFVNMLEAKSSLSRLVEAIEQGRERELSSFVMVVQLPAWLQLKKHFSASVSVSPKASLRYQIILMCVMKKLHSYLRGKWRLEPAAGYAFSGLQSFWIVS